MSVSLEALAMAGEDYVNFGIDMEEWERTELEETPAHLLADVDDDQQQYWSISNINDCITDNNYDNDMEFSDEYVTHFEASQGYEASRGSLSLRGLVMMIKAKIKLTMLIRWKILTDLFDVIM